MRRAKKPKAATIGPLPADLTDGQLVALGLWFVKSATCHALLATGRTGASKGDPTDDSMAATDRVLALAKAHGVGAEFLELVFELELFRVTVTPMG